ncbi:GNAT family N-acetyltransferase [Streptomyces endophyticus]|uniref:GNAT family N-acetyltransferase n=1 Tax=Streptomyces endophyticus TaxID=714166 RepID=A0ABU6FB71_9ACTN|nr:GNAT family N-acetyltransferase [Streptomyces endophyticus]MEB8340590.1 GNAT family N-acetyltransferase [Streptomyces endophyticus]
MDYVIRPVRADEWRAAKELRLAALRDPAAPLAFLETYEDAAAQSDEFWQGRALRASHGTTALQLVVESGAGPSGAGLSGEGGRWDGSVVVLVEEAGAEDFWGQAVERRQVQLVAVYVRPEARGTGVAGALFSAAVEWAFGLKGVTRVRLYVHEDNRRAEAFYRKFGFVHTGGTVPNPGDPSKMEREMEFKLP